MIIPQDEGRIKTVHLLIHLWVLITLVGCKSEEKFPYLRDPIYLDIKRTMEAYDAEATAQAAKASAAQIQYNKTEVRSIDRKTTKRDLEKAQLSYEKAAQQAEYYRIKLKLREAEATISYKRAFHAGKDWPNPKEYESYLLQKKLQETSRNWRDRLPKPGDIDIPGLSGDGEGGGQ